MRSINCLPKNSADAWYFHAPSAAPERITKNLNQQGVRAAMIHGDRSQSQRSAALAGFQQGRFRILVATDVASRGIHVQDIASRH